MKGARGELRLLWLERKLLELGVPFVPVREPDQPWNNQLMVIGLVPVFRDELAPAVEKVLNEFQRFKFDPGATQVAGATEEAPGGQPSPVEHAPVSAERGASQEDRGARSPGEATRAGPAWPQGVLPPMRLEDGA